MIATTPTRPAARRLVRPLGSALLALALTLPTLAACGSASTSAADQQTLTIYSGRSEELVAPLLDQLEEATGAQVDVRYGESPALAAQLLEEGDASPADLFFSQDAGALGALAKADQLQRLDSAITDRVLPGYADADGRWVATSARARVIAYDPDQAPEVPTWTTVDEVLDPAYSGKIGYAPTNASFHSFVTALRVTRGEQAAREWLTKFAANKPVAYEKNSAVLAGVDAGEVALGLINHYYWHELVAEVGADQVQAKIHFLGTDDPGALINVAGVGILASSEQTELATAAAQFLVSDEAQQFFADQTAEYPVVDGITTTAHDLGSLTDLHGSSVDINQLDSLEQTLAMLDEVGLT